MEQGHGMLWAAVQPLPLGIGLLLPSPYLPILLADGQVCMEVKVGPCLVGLSHLGWLGHVLHSGAPFGGESCPIPGCKL